MKLWDMGRKGSKLTNLLGMVLAFGIAFGGLFGVRLRLAQEEAALLQGGGAVELPVQDGKVDIQVSGKAEESGLSEAELVQTVENLRSRTEVYPHEPRQGQLSMAQAIACGKGWMEDFCIPYFGAPENGLQEYKANCYLWSTQEGAEGEEKDSYWTVALAGQGMDAELIVHGGSGQVLEASVSFLLPSEFGEMKNPVVFLQEYADSFGFAEDDVLYEDGIEVPENDIHTIYQSIGSRGVYAVMTADLIRTSKGNWDGGASDDTEVFRFELFLDIVNRS